MMLGKGVTYSTSCKHDAKGQVLWTRHFLAAQGTAIPTTTIYQDSTILLAENGTTSSSRCTKHLDIQYFFVTDKIKNGEVKVAYCPIDNMLADFSLNHYKVMHSCGCGKKYKICPVAQVQLCTGVC